MTAQGIHSRGGRWQHWQVCISVWLLLTLCQSQMSSWWVRWLTGMCWGWLDQLLDIPSPKTPIHHHNHERSIPHKLPDNYLFLWFPSTWEPKSLYDIRSSSRHPQKQQFFWYTNTHVHTHICTHGILSHHFVLKFCSGCWCLLSIEEDFVAWEIVCCVHEIVGQEPEVVYLD